MSYCKCYIKLFAFKFSYVMFRIDDQQQADGKELQPREIHQYLSRVMYQRRSKTDPLWNQILVAGVGDKDDRVFFGQCDLYGSAFEGDTLATGYGAYIAQPLLRKAYRPDLTEDEARKVLVDCMRVLLYRDARTINKARIHIHSRSVLLPFLLFCSSTYLRSFAQIQIGRVSTAGIEISDPMKLDTYWTNPLFVNPAQSVKL